MTFECLVDFTLAKGTPEEEEPGEKTRTLSSLCRTVYYRAVPIRDFLERLRDSARFLETRVTFPREFRDVGIVARSRSAPVSTVSRRPREGKEERRRGKKRKGRIDDSP